MKREARFEQSKDYQLPQGELWWLCKFRGNIISTPYVGYGARGLIGFEGVSILFHSSDVQTWFQANKYGELLAREYFNFIDLPDTFFKVKVTLWES